MTIFGSGVTALYQFAAFNAFPSSGTWIPGSAYERSDGKTRGREVDALLGRQGHNRRDPEASAPSLAQNGGSLSVPICMREIGLWLSATFGACESVEGSGPNEGVFTHVWESGKDAPLFLAQSKKLKDGWYERTTGLCVNTLGINLAKEGGYPRAAISVLSRNVVKATEQVSGTIGDAYALLRIPASNPYVKRNGVQAPTTTFSFNYANNAERYDILNGNEDPESIDLGEAAINGSFGVRLTDATFDDLAVADTKEPWEFGYIKTNGLGVGKNASLIVELSNLSIDLSPKSINSRGRLVHTYNFVGEQSADDPAVRVTLVNDVPGYPAA